MMGNPLALIGLIAVAIPIIIHMLARHHSRIERFPTLQFISLSRLNPTNRRRISDLLLLLARVGIIAVAVLALAQPSCSSRPSEASKILTRVVIVDTSASMSRLTPSGPAASVIARQLADRESAGVLADRVDTDSPASALEGAIAWLAVRPGQREIVIVSDFQRSAIDSADLATIPVDIGLTLHAIATTSTSVARVANTEPIATFADPSEATAADASWRAIGRPRPNDTTGRIAITYASAATRDKQIPRGVHPEERSDERARDDRPIDSPWMARIITSIQRDPTFAAAAAESHSTTPPPHHPTLPDTLALNSAGIPLLTAGRNGSRLQFEMLDEPGSLFSAAFNAALMRAIAPTTLGVESDSTSWAAEELARWDRPATPFQGNQPNASDGRWFWLACAALIGLETFMRTRRPERRVAA